MKVQYDKYYQTENLFGRPYPELIEFYSNIKKKGKLLDLGYGQGRDSIALAKLGFTVTGIDYSKVGIEQLNKRIGVYDRQQILIWQRMSAVDGWKSPFKPISLPWKPSV